MDEPDDLCRWDDDGGSFEPFQPVYGPDPDEPETVA